MESVIAEATLKNILSFGHLFLCCLIVFGEIIHPTSDQTASNIAIVRVFEVRGLVRLADFTKCLERACVLLCRFWSYASKMSEILFDLSCWEHV